MKLPPIRNRQWNYLAMSFFLPLVGLLTAMVLTGCVPFGTRSWLSSDAWHQYFPFFKAFRDTLRSGSSLLYNPSIGLGIDYLGLIAYYLASPLNLLSVILPESWLLGYFDLLVPIKLSFSGLFFAIFLKHMFHQADLSLPLFAGFYALCSWALGYMWNIMWLDTFAVLPLVALGTVQLLRDKKFALYTISLFFAIFSNYYIGFFICIFVLLLFVCYQICRCTSIKRLALDFCRIGIFTVLAIGMTAILELPALVALGTTHSSVNVFPENFAVNIASGEGVSAAKLAWSTFKSAKELGEGNLLGLWLEAVVASIPPILEGMQKVAGNLSGGVLPTYKEGLPNIFCGVGTLLFAFLFLTSREVKLRDKLCSIFLLLFFMISFILRQLDYIWHGFHFTNMIPYRFSFLFSFVLLYMAYRAFLLRESFQLWQLIVSGVLSGLIFLCYKDLTDPVFLTFNGIFLALFLASLVYTCLQNRPIPETEEKTRLLAILKSRQYHKKMASFTLAGVMGMELIMVITNGTVQFPYASVAGYPRGTEDVKAVVEYMQETDNTPYYRVETTHTQTLNDGALLGYNGLSTFTSSANVKVTEFMRLLGYAAKNNYNRYCYEESSPVANLFLNLKYMIDREGQLEENSYFDLVHQQGNVSLLKNNAYLPLGFLAELSFLEKDFSSFGNAFYFQNDLFTAATGIAEDVWTLTVSQELTINGANTPLTSQNADIGYCSYKTGANSSTLYYTYEISKAGFMCLDLEMSARNSFSIWKNGERLYSESISLPQTLSVSQVVPGDIVEVQVTCRANESGSITIQGATLNDEIFRSGYDVLAASTLNITQYSDTKIEGTINCNREGLLYTSIPQNGNWTITVDGEEATVALVGDVMVGVVLTEGTHTVCFTYRNHAFTAGLAISVLSLLVFCSICFVKRFYPKSQYKGKYEQQE